MKIRLWKFLDWFVGPVLDRLLKRRLGKEPDYEGYLLARPDVRESDLPVRLHLLIYGLRELGNSSWVAASVGTSRDHRTNVLLVVHDLSETGAPILGLELAKSLNKMGYGVFVVALSNGPLESEFRDASDAFMIDLTPKMGFSVALELAMRRLRPVYAFVNSFESWSTIPAITRTNTPYSVLIHESSFYFSNDQIIPELSRTANRVVFSSSLTAKHWEMRFGELGEKKQITRQPVRLIKSGSRYLSEIGISKLSSKKIIWAAGHVQYRKGADIFLDLCEQIEKLFPEQFDFFWVGNGYHDTRDLYARFLEMRLKTSTISEKFSFLPAGPAYLRLLEEGHAFVSTSRLDPFPNVLLEALSLNQPCFWFADTVGTTDLLTEEEKEVFTAEFPQVKDLATKIGNYVVEGGKSQHVRISHEASNKDFESYLRSISGGVIQSDR